MKTLRSNREALGIVFLSIVVAIAGIVWFGEKSHTLVITSETIPVLVAHEHKDLDSIIDLHHGEVVGFESGTVVLDRDVWINGFKWEVENAPIETLHHFIFTRADKPAVLCPNGFSANEEILVMGSDTFVNEFNFPPEYGIFLPKGTPLELSAVLHNPLPPFGPGGTYENVRLKLTLLLNDPGKTYNHVRLVRLSAEDPACTPRSSTFNVPANTENFLKKIDSPISSYTFEKDSQLLLVGAHAHGWDGAGPIRVYLNDELLYEFTPQRVNENPWSWATPSRLVSKAVKKGDTISLTSTYSNPHDKPLINEAMGMIMIAFSEE